MLSEHAPTISCILIDIDPIHIEQYNLQDYPNKELVTCEILSTKFPIHEFKDAAVELALGDMVCWWNGIASEEPTRLLEEYRAWRRGESRSMISKEQFFKQGSMYYTNEVRNNL